MTARERVLTLLSGKQPDKVSWLGDLDYWATALVGRGQKPQGFQRTAAYLDWHRELGVGFYLQGYFPLMPENLSSEVVGPDLFEKFMRPYQSEWAAAIKAAGKFSCIHLDGTLKGLLRQECTVGLSFIEAMTPAPVCARRGRPGAAGRAGSARAPCRRIGGRVRAV